MPTAKPAEHLATLAGAVCALALAGLLLAQGAEASVIHACVKRTSGATRIVSAKAKCRKGEQKLSWNTSGPAGPAGRSGATGAEGKAGANGTDGAVAGFTESTSTTGVSLPPAEGRGAPQQGRAAGELPGVREGGPPHRSQKCSRGQRAVRIGRHARHELHRHRIRQRAGYLRLVLAAGRAGRGLQLQRDRNLSLQGAVSSTLTTTLTLACATVSQDKGVESKAGDAQLGAIQTSHNS